MKVTRRLRQAGAGAGQEGPDQVGKIVVTAPDTPPVETPLLAAAPLSSASDRRPRWRRSPAYLIWGNKR